VPRHRRRPGGDNDDDDANENDYESMEDELTVDVDATETEGSGVMTVGHVAPPRGGIYPVGGGGAPRRTATAVEASFRPGNGGYMSTAVIPSHQQQLQHHLGTSVSAASYVMPSAAGVGGGQMSTTRPPLNTTGYI
jgi:hypothetical protein